MQIGNTRRGNGKNNEKGRSGIGERDVTVKKLRAKSKREREREREGNERTDEWETKREKRVARCLIRRKDKGQQAKQGKCHSIFTITKFVSRSSTTVDLSRNPLNYFHSFPSRATMLLRTIKLAERTLSIFHSWTLPLSIYSLFPYHAISSLFLLWASSTVSLFLFPSESRRIFPSFFISYLSSFRR